MSPQNIQNLKAQSLQPSEALKTKIRQVKHDWPPTAMLRGHIKLNNATVA